LGAASLDYVATVSKYPSPDEKIRAQTFNIYGGGNCANTFTALSRLDLAETHLLTKLGTDMNGKLIIAELRESGVNIDNVIVSPDASTLLVYVIVDDATKTRTCIANPTAVEVSSADVIRCISGPGSNTAASIDERSVGFLHGASLVHLDSRHTAAAVTLAAEANLRGIPVTVDVEKDRPHLAALLPHCDVVFTNERFPQLYFPAAAKGDDACVSVISCSDETTAADTADGAAPSSATDAGANARSRSLLDTRGDLASTLHAMTEFFFLQPASDSHSSGDRSMDSVKTNEGSKSGDNDSPSFTSSTETAAIRGGRAKTVITTLGSDGALLIRRRSTSTSTSTSLLPLSSSSSLSSKSLVLPLVAAAEASTSSAPLPRSLISAAPLKVERFVFRRHISVSSSSSPSSSPSTSPSTDSSYEDFDVIRYLPTYALMHVLSRRSV
jgi:sugar/nucleoside kinase (ribokinase family)